MSHYKRFDKIRIFRAQQYDKMFESGATFAEIAEHYGTGEKHIRYMLEQLWEMGDLPDLATTNWY